MCVVSGWVPRFLLCRLLSMWHWIHNLTTLFSQKEPMKLIFCKGLWGISIPLHRVLSSTTCVSSSQIQSHANSFIRGPSHPRLSSSFTVIRDTPSSRRHLIFPIFWAGNLCLFSLAPMFINSSALVSESFFWFCDHSLNVPGAQALPFPART